MPMASRVYRYDVMHSALRVRRRDPDGGKAVKITGWSFNRRGMVVVVPLLYAQRIVPAL